MLGTGIVFKTKIVFRYLKEIYQLILYKIKNQFLWNYYFDSLREPKINSVVPHNPIIQNEIKSELRKEGFNVVDLKINISNYQNYLKNSEYHKFPRYYNLNKKSGFFIEKSLEHYLAADLLNLSKDDIYLDIANANSPTPGIYHKLFGCEVYRQDLWFPKGIHKKIIGGNASNMPIKDEFATKMALHCSFEHFERNSDKNFIKEASRVLKKEGKLCIIPLYLFNRYAIQTDPAMLTKNNLSFEEDATLYCAKGWKNRHGRHYDIPHLIKRIQKYLKGLKLTIYYVQNEKEIDPSCYVKFIALFEKL